MNKTSIAKLVKRGLTLVSDGAWGTFLQKKGLQPGECPEEWCLQRRGDLLDVATSYAAAGADMIQTNSFGANRFKLEHFGLADKVDEINAAAAEISREAVGPEKHVIASMGPTGKILLVGEVGEEEIYEAFKEQATALERGGADAVCVETMSALDEGTLAVKAAKENTNLEVICTFTFTQNAKDPNTFRSMMGVSPTDMAEAALAAGADVIGTNCGNGMELMEIIVAELRDAAPEAPILVHANAGMPRNLDGVDVFPETPEQMGALVPALIAAGANVIGGCCGTTPDHIRAIKEAVSKL